MDMPALWVLPDENLILYFFLQNLCGKAGGLETRDTILSLYQSHVLDPTCPCLASPGIQPLPPSLSSSTADSSRPCRVPTNVQHTISWGRSQEGEGDRDGGVESGCGGSVEPELGVLSISRQCFPGCQGTIARDCSFYLLNTSISPTSLLIQDPRVSLTSRSVEDCSKHFVLQSSLE